MADFDDQLLAGAFADFRDRVAPQAWAGICAAAAHDTCIAAS